LLWRAHIRWRPVFVYLIGCAVALALCVTRYVPDKPIALLLLGVTPFMARLTPPGFKPDPESVWQGTVYGTICMGLMLMTGVSGPLLDTFFLGAKFDRRASSRPRRPASREPFHQADLFRRHHRPGRNAQSGACRGRDRGLDARHHAVAAHSRSDERAAVSPLGQPADHHVASYYILYGGWLLLFARSSSRRIDGAFP